MATKTYKIRHPGDLQALLMEWHREEVERSAAAQERAAMCAAGVYAWYSEVRSLELFYKLADESGLSRAEFAVSLPASWWPADKQERFYLLPKAQRPRCGARCRDGHACRAAVVIGSDGWARRRCRLHGGLSTGPKTTKGRAAIAESNRRRAGNLMDAPFCGKPHGNAI